MIFVKKIVLGPTRNEMGAVTVTVLTSRKEYLVFEDIGEGSFTRLDNLLNYIFFKTIPLIYFGLSAELAT